MSKTPICDKHKYETDLGAEVVPFHVAIELELKLHQRELEIGEANAKWLRSDKQLAEVRADADHWKSECNALQRMAHEARAEIEQMRARHLDRASATLWAIMRHAFMDGAFKGYQHGTEKRLRVQYFDEWCQKNYPEAVDKAIAQLRLIEQMREALRLALSEARSTHCEQIILAALAAERGE